MYIVTLILCLYLVMFFPKKNKKVQTLLLTCGGLIVLLNFFWVLPAFLGGMNASLTAITSRSLLW